MINGKSHHRRLAPLLLIVAAVLPGAVMTSAASAGESISFFPKSETGYRAPSQENGILVASMGHTGGALNVSLTPPYEHPHGFLDGQNSAQKQEVLSEVFLFLRYPW